MTRNDFISRIWPHGLDWSSELALIATDDRLFTNCCRPNVDDYLHCLAAWLATRDCSMITPIQPIGYNLSWCLSIFWSIRSIDWRNYCLLHGRQINKNTNYFRHWLARSFCYKIDWVVSGLSFNLFIGWQRDYLTGEREKIVFWDLYGMAT